MSGRHLQFSRKLRFLTKSPRRRHGDNSTAQEQATLGRDDESRGSEATLLPTTTTALPSHTKPVAPDRASDPQGLTLLYEPEEPPVADIVFIHGLGDSSRLSWSHNKDLRLFWPQEWLPLDRDVGKARLFTFGYNAFFHSPFQANTVGIADVAKNLQYDLLYARHAAGHSFHIGHVGLCPS